MSAPASERPLYRLLLRPEPGVNGTQALRRFLKVALRSYGLRCIAAYESTRELRQAEPEGRFRDGTGPADQA